MPSSYLSSSSLNRALVRLAAVAAIEHLVLELALCCGRIFAVAYDSTDSKIGRDRTVEAGARVGDKIAVYSRGGVFFQAARLSPSLRQRDKRAISSSDEY